MEEAKQPARIFTCIPYEPFEKEMSGVADNRIQEIASEVHAFISFVDEKKALVKALLERETNEFFDKARSAFMHTAYRFQRIISVEGFMADEMIEIFELLLRNLPNNDELPEDKAAEKEILKGISETVHIKIESIKDSVSVFNENGAKLVSGFNAAMKEPDPSEKLAACKETLDLWRESMADADKSGMASFFDACAKLDFNTELLQHYEKKESEFHQKIDKALVGFKKDTLLYEINTYEEILTYSVSRLRDSGNVTVEKAVALLDESHRILEMMLKKNNITPIRPAAHEMFNGKEHEVLMAEKQEGFNKGEIIKVMNSGYKMKDTVILRANVIAAK